MFIFESGSARLHAILFIFKKEYVGRTPTGRAEARELLFTNNAVYPDPLSLCKCPTNTHVVSQLPAQENPTKKTPPTQVTARRRTANARACFAFHETRREPKQTQSDPKETQADLSRQRQIQTGPNRHKETPTD